MAIASLLVGGGRAPGGTVFTGDRVMVEAAGLEPVGSGAEHLWKFQLIAVGIGDAVLGGWDGQMEGLFHQQILGDSSTPTLDEPLPDHQLITPLDSHFLVHGSQILSVLPPEETFDPQLPSQELPDATGPDADQAQVGFGTALRGTFARLGGALPRWPIAQLVVPEGSTVTLDFELGFGGPDPPSAEPVQVSFMFDPSLLRVCGDFDADADVDSTDLTSLILGWTGSLDPGVGDRTFAQGDCDGDGDVDGLDLTGLILNWTAAQAQASAAPVPVPEPPAGWFALVAGAALVWGVRGKGRRAAGAKG